MFNETEVVKIQEEVLYSIASRSLISRKTVINRLKSGKSKVLSVPKNGMSLQSWICEIGGIASGDWKASYRSKLYEEFSYIPIDEIVEVRRNLGIIIFGYADLGRKVADYASRELEISNVVYCDNSRSKQGKHDGNTIYSLREAINKFPGRRIVVASLRHSKQMKEQLIKEGVALDRIVTDLPWCIVHEMLNNERNQRLMPRKSIHIEVNINKNCNLNCKGCDHFAPVAEADTLELDIFEQDMKRLSEVMAGRIHRIILLGGEPLLNEHLLDYVRIARRCLPETEVFVATNGTLLGRMRDDFWTALKESRTGLMVTKYPVKLDYEALKEKAEEKGVLWEYLGSSESGRTLWHFPLDLSGSQDAMDSFIHCANANSCHTLERGKLYTCSIAPNIKAFNSFFGKNIPLKNEDGIDIYKARNANEILEFLAKPINFCRYCNVSERTYDNGWEVSKKDIKEWSL